MWNVYGTENGYASEEELYDAIVKVSKNKKMPKLMNCLYLTDVVFFQAPIYLSEIGVEISNKVESYIYLDKEDPQATSKVLNKAKETGVDMWMAAMSETLGQNKNRSSISCRRSWKKSATPSILKVKRKDCVA